MYTEHPTSPSQSTEPSAGTGFSASNVSATAPGQLRVIKRNGTVVSYDVSKISVAMTKAFLAVEGDTAAVSGRVHETVNNLTDLITATFKRRMPSGGTIHIDRKSTRLNSSHVAISYAVFCLKKKNNNENRKTT